MHAEKLVVRAAGGCLMVGAATFVTGWVLHVPALTAVGKYLGLAGIAIGWLVPLGAIAAIFVTRKRPPVRDD